MSHEQRSWPALVGVVSSLLGALSALVLIFWPAQVAEGPVSYPFTTTGFLIAQAWFFVQHLGMLVLLVAFTVSNAMGSGRMARAGAWVAVAGMALLTVAELNTMRYAEWDEDVANEGLMGTSYGVSCTLVGIGMLVAGIGVLRARTWSGWHRWVPLAIGIATFTVLTPGMFGGFVTARLAIGFWVLLFAALGWGLYLETRQPATPRSTPTPVPVR